MPLSSQLLCPLLEAAHNTPPVIVFANYSYREIADNWIRAARRANVANYWIIAISSGDSGFNLAHLRPGIG